jgi:hypothetical protein
MATLVPEQTRRLAELDARERLAWREYRDALHDLDPKAYDAQEPPAWEQLQATLRVLHAEREAVGAGRW